MGGAEPSLYGFTAGQLGRLCSVAGISSEVALADLGALLDPIRTRSLTEAPAWPTDISDDHTPVEFSLALQSGMTPTVRVLGEAMSAQPGRRSNLRTALALVDRFAEDRELRLDQFHRIRRLFLDDDPRHDFAMWFSLVYKQQLPPEVKIYFNPDARGTQDAPDRVAEALHQLQLDGAYRTMLDHGVRPGELNRADRFTFFALDLHARPHARVKIYVTHRDAEARDLERAASAVPGADLAALRDFLDLTGCDRSLTGRPALSGYTFVRGDTARPSTYSLYLPIRDYVRDDEQARDIAVSVLDRFGIDPARLDKALDAVARRPLADGVGMIALLSLRLNPFGPPGVTVYLSSEAYEVFAPRREHVHTGSASCR
jgi:DMATS type aromatic prenyltransferase